MCTSTLFCTAEQGPLGDSPFIKLQDGGGGGKYEIHNREDRGRRSVAVGCQAKVSVWCWCLTSVTVTLAGPPPMSRPADTASDHRCQRASRPGGHTPPASHALDLGAPAARTVVVWICLFICACLRHQGSVTPVTQHRELVAHADLLPG